MSRSTRRSARLAAAEAEQNDDERFADSGAEPATASPKATEHITEANDPAGLADPFGTRAAEVDSFLDAATNVAAYLQPDPALALQSRKALQAVYEAAAAAFQDASRVNSRASNAGAAPQILHQLHVDGFDSEQIWTQLELHTDAATKLARTHLRVVGDSVKLVEPDMEEAVDELLQGAPADGLPEAASVDDRDDDDDEDDDQDMDARDLTDLDYDAMLAAGSAARRRSAADLDSDADDSALAGASDDDDGLVDDDSSGEEAMENSGREDEGADVAARSGLGALLPTEDEFFRLDDMELFLAQAEASEAAGDRGGLHTREPESTGTLLGADAGAAAGAGADADEEDEDDDEESVDLFAEDEAEQFGGAHDDDGFGSDKGEEERESEEEDEGVEEDALDASMSRALRAAGAAAGADDNIRYEDFFGAGKPHEAPHARKRKRAALPPVDDDQDDANLDADSDDEAEPAHPAARAAAKQTTASAAESEAVLSTHERKQRRIAAQIAELEAAAMAEADWHLRGEARASDRPRDSALAVDLDFEQTLRPAPQPTEETTRALEDVIKQRILDLKFDNVVRVVPAGPQKQREVVELDDKRSKAGLADLYEEDHLPRATGTAQDKHAALRLEAKKLFRVLCGKLDALSHLSYTPKPIVTDLEIRVDTPAIAMEEAAPVTLSTANMKAPEEAYAKKAAERQLKAPSELTQSEKKQRRASKKRIKKRKEAEKEMASGIAANPKGIKSAREDAQAEKAARAMKKQQRSSSKKEPSRGLFKQLQDERAAATS